MKTIPTQLQESLYNICLADETVNLPVSLPLHVVRKIHSKFNKGSDVQKARALFDWVQSNITYGRNKLPHLGGIQYRTAKETLYGREGVCGEMAYLYILSARVCNLKSNYVSVKKDFQGKKVSHGCAGVYLPHLVLVDPAYHSFNIKHKEISVLTDKEMLHRFNQWR